MKKYLALFLTMAMSVTMLAGCGGGEQPAQDNVETPADSAERTACVTTTLPARSAAVWISESANTTNTMLLST